MTGTRGGEQSMRRHGLAMLAGRAATLGIAASSGVALARLLSVPAFGAYSGAGAVATTVLLLGAFGVDQLFLSGRLTMGSLVRRIGHSFALSVIIAAVAALAWPSLSWRVRVAAGLLGLAGAARLLWLPWLLGPQRELDIARRARREVLLTAVIGLAPIPAAVSGSALITAAVGAAATLAVGGMAYRAARRAGPHVHESAASSAPPEAGWAPGLWYAVSGAFYTVYFQVDLALLAALSSSAQTARYKAAYLLVTIAVVIPIALHNEVLRPRLYREPDAGRRRVIARSYGWLAVTLGLAGGGLVFWFGPWAVRWAFGHPYAVAGPVIRVLALALPLHYVASWAGNVAVAEGWTRRVVVAQALLAAVNVAGNVIVIPRHGAAGAAAMTVVTEALSAVLTLCLVAWLRLSSARAGSRSPQPADAPDPATMASVA